MAIGDYFKLNYHKLLMAIDGIFLLMAIGGYYIGGYLKLNYHRILMVISGYWWLFY